jgi:hypothetical protein
MNKRRGDLAESGALDELEVSEYTVSRASPRGHSDLGQFTLKALIIIGLIAGAFILALLVPRIERGRRECPSEDAAIHEGRRRSILGEA